jgi:tryptophanyl-tRNA synthetase
VIELLGPIQERYADLRADDAELQRLLTLGAEKARAASAPTIEAMYKRMGFLRLASD